VRKPPKKRAEVTLGSPLAKPREVSMTSIAAEAVACWPAPSNARASS